MSSGAITSILILGILGFGAYYVWTNKDSIMGMIKSGGSPATATSTDITSSGSCNPALMKAITHNSDPNMNLKFNGCITVTGTVVGATQPHYSPDGDMVFALKLDPQYSQYVNAKNNDPKYQGGIWCEAVCQAKNVSPHPWHKGDCATGGPYPKFPLPKKGDRLKVTGIHAIDMGEGGHAEIHPVSSLEILTGNNSSAKTKTKIKTKSKSNYAFVYDGQFHYPEHQEISYLHSKY